MKRLKGFEKRRKRKIWLEWKMKDDKKISKKEERWGIFIDILDK